jgi:hypothetical protein
LLLGPNAVVVVSRKSHEYRVQEMHDDKTCETHGTGDSWETALADAASRLEFLKLLGVEKQ